MRWSFRKVAGTVAIAAPCLLLARAPSALACSCAPPPPPAVALERAGAVFEGVTSSLPEPLPEGGVLYRFEVLRVWKGSPGAQAAITTAAISAACGRSYAKGSTWLVYASRRDDGTLSDSLCSRSRPSEQAAEDFAALGEAAQGGEAGVAENGATVAGEAGAGEDSAVGATSAATPAPGGPAGGAPAAVDEPVAPARDATGPQPPAADEVATHEPEDEPGCAMAGRGTGGGLAWLGLFALAAAVAPARRR